ncbi:MAG: hypothetical protein ABJF50_20500 [Paracoccaceae bacterium]
MSWKDPLARPPDWVDRSRDWLNVDDSKVPRYRTDTGLEYWIEARSTSILTSDPKVSLTFHGNDAHSYKGHSFAILHLDGDRIIITSDDPDPEKITFAWDFADKTEEGVFIWRVDHLFRAFHIPNFDRYPWVNNWHVLPKVHVQGIAAFRDKDHQNRAIGLIKTLLSCHNGNVMSAVRGKETRGHVVIGDALQAKLNNGSLIATHDGHSPLTDSG